jgi:hypothetical protein
MTYFIVWATAFGPNQFPTGRFSDDSLINAIWKQSVKITYIRSYNLGYNEFQGTMKSRQSLSVNWFPNDVTHVSIFYFLLFSW